MSDNDDDDDDARQLARGYAISVLSTLRSQLEGIVVK